MMKTTQREIKAMNAIDLTHEKSENLYKLHGDLEQIAYSVGVYGVTAALFKSRKTGKLYKVCTRSTALFCLL